MLLWYPEISSSAALMRMVLVYLSGDVTTADRDSCLKVRALRKQANRNLIGSGLDLHCTLFNSSQSMLSCSSYLQNGSFF